MRVQHMLWLPALVLGLALGGCTAEQTDEGEMPEVQVEGGDMPNYDVDAADVNVSADTQQVVVPDVDVNNPEGGNNQ